MASETVHVDSATHHDEIAPEALGRRKNYTSPQFIGTVVATALGLMSAYAGFNVPANILYIINEDLHGGGKVHWAPVIYTLGLAVALPLVGRLSDIFGRRWFYIGGTVLAVIGNVVCSRASGIDSFLAGTAMIGFASGVQVSFNLVLGELVAAKDRGPFNALIFAGSVPFSIFAPMVARSFELDTEQHWRWCYYLGLIINTIGVGLWFVFYHPPDYRMLHVRGRSKRDMVKSLDWFGMFLFIAGLSVLLIGLNWGGTSYPWDSAHVLATVLVGFATLAAFCIWEGFTTAETIYIPMKLFRNIPYDALVVCAAIGAMIYYSSIVMWPTLIQAIWYQNDTRMVGYYSCFVGGGLITGQILGGLGHKYIPRTRIQMVVSSCVMVGFIGAMASSTPESLHRSCAFIFLGTVGAGYVESLSLSSIALVWDASDFGLVASVMGCIRTAAGAIATSIYPNILTNEFKKYLPRYVSEATLNKGLPADSLPALLEALTTGNFSTVPGITQEIIEAATYANKRAWARSSETVFLVTLAFGGLMLIASLFAPDVEVYLTDFVPRALHGMSRGEKQSDSDLSPTPLALNDLNETNTKSSSSAKASHIEDEDVAIFV
ncbi:uncharacterized protein A1O9_06919 [Exophiala aquamarina CBS 119918]|uniref:Major facilitator superfamily (MFS) profile domain-containing protein n=1 Tax=Exophiala aquamarina CBS 119918 TaxID=1182545 RepID=A0A072P9E4_9EURO|nr:uncharacterized protein A1O9_06919 [Exophiala aquamarina CBS 119918]KEF56729.1 hypothetical protein A1O9_06919 [Exophiala aquamarina CBS 119918]